MYRTLKTRFQAKKEVIQKLFECNRISAEVWNECLRLAKEHHLETGKWITKTELQKATKGRFSIHSQSIQAVVHKYIFARDGAKEARKKGEKIKYPYKKKKHFNTKWAKDGFVLHEDGTLELSLGIWNRKRQSPLVVKIDKEKLPNGKVKEIELVYDRGLWLCLSYEDGKKPKENPCKNRVAIDPGEIHTIAAICENGESLIITGRKIRSIHRLRNKKLKELQKLMSRCKKGSKQWKKYNRAKQYVLSKSEAQLKDALHKTTRQFVRWCLENQVKEVVIGDIEGIQRNTKKKRNKKTNQKLSNWSFGKLFDYLKYKLNAEGIQIEKKDESYTSQTCPVCGKKNKSSSRNYTCQCGYKRHRDIHGAMNLFAKVYYGEIRPLEFTVKPFTYRRIA
ncbi:transposase [Geobacillus stearothermophilus]|uniref:Transposase n=24 Tax=Bacillales TaxID=1385 RepID=A0A150MMZ6_GEOSE|nr:RNA-guided endonuclease TnpB family protein [Geobacillus stearothermophilus]KYD25831.1 hypothetical protein B4109_1955 [Geobacillus stearothermophilus]MED3735197.1 transposase [Geobacillus stearothermophilus]MED3767947.1 transposase [Geobacillus stearothermophilus]MED3775238.1 transposase [Geobacillus stearothermophilus]MED3784355.1 transposase [Geobacillus stearothermophilus]